MRFGQRNQLGFDAQRGGQHVREVDVEAFRLPVDVLEAERRQIGRYSDANHPFGENVPEFVGVGRAARKQHGRGDHKESG